MSIPVNGQSATTGSRAGVHIPGQCAAGQQCPIAGNHRSVIGQPRYRANRRLPRRRGSLPSPDHPIDSPARLFTDHAAFDQAAIPARIPASSSPPMLLDIMQSRMIEPASAQMSPIPNAVIKLPSSVHLAIRLPGPVLIAFRLQSLIKKIFAAIEGAGDIGRPEIRPFLMVKLFRPADCTTQ